SQRRESFAWRIVPVGTVRITGAADVQGDRLKWGVYAWGIGLSCWRIDGGTIIGDPQAEASWRELDQVLDRGYADTWGRRWRIDAFGVDTGYLSQRVYAWARRHAAERRVYAVDGRGGWKLPPLLRPRRVTVNLVGRAVGKVLLWPVGTWDLKSELYAALRRTIEGPDADGRWPPGAMHFSEACDEEFFRELTAEHLTVRERAGGLVERIWIKDRTTPNEEHDIQVYSRALVHHLTDAWTPEEWVKEAARLGQPPEAAQRDLLHWIQPAPSAPTEGAAPAAPPSTTTATQPAESPRAVNEPRRFFRRGTGHSSLMN
ncbi:MAG TPA: terminase gpA endonuclease subunit, partial [Vineibacter sp.]|nr:terminase gpA endonuclease subunit [Vineibacter sp.]